MMVYNSSIVIGIVGIFQSVVQLDRIMAVQLLFSRPVMTHNWLLALRAMNGATYRSITASGCGSLYCEQLYYTLVVELLAKC